MKSRLSVVMTSQVDDPSEPNDEGITALHNAICAGHFDIVKFLVEYGCDVNSPDSDGWYVLYECIARVRAPAECTRAQLLIPRSTWCMVCAAKIGVHTFKFFSWCNQMFFWCD